MMYMMYMFFYQSTHLTFLLEPLDAKSIGPYIGCLVAAFLMCILLEFLSFCQFMVKSNRSEITILTKLSSIALYAVQSFLAFLVMLLVMTFNAVMFITIILGLVTGYMYFGLKKLNKKAEMNDEGYEVVAEKCCA